MKALSKDPANRYPDVMAFTNAFQAAVASPADAKDGPAAQETEETGILGRMRGMFRGK